MRNRMLFHSFRLQQTKKLRKGRACFFLYFLLKSSQVCYNQTSMVEGEAMPTPEQERPLSAEQAKQPSFEERLRGLIEPKTDEEGKVLQAVIKNEKLRRLGRLALEPRNQTPEGLGKLLGKGDDWCLDEQVPEDEWSVLAGEFGEERERLLREKEGERREKLAEEEKPSELLKTAARYTKEMKGFRWKPKATGQARI